LIIGRYVKLEIEAGGGGNCWQRVKICKAPSYFF
jgi:hypothetical protein